MLSATLRRGAYRTPTCSLLIRRELLDEVAGADESFTTMFEDQALLAKLHTTASTVISGTTTARYRQHPGSTVARAVHDRTYVPGGLSRTREAFLRWLADYLPTRPTGSDAELRELVNAALVPYNSRIRRWRGMANFRVRGALAGPAVRKLGGAARRVRAKVPVRMGSLRRVTPLSRQFGFDRGLPVDRYYIEQFLEQQSQVISGRVLEVGDSSYTRRFGNGRVQQADVLNVAAGHPETTFVADLSDADHLPSDAFDCIVLTQTLHLVYDLNAAVRTLRRILRPGGTLLATFPGISPLSSDEWAATWQWSLTPVSARRLFGEVFGEANTEVVSYGNVLTSAAFLYGLAAHELRSRELAVSDPQFPMLITVRAVRPATER